MNKFYAVIQHGHVCFGVGRSRGAAIADASEWLDCDEPLVETQLVEWYNAVDGDLVLCECTEEYYRAVLEDGSVLWCMDNGVIKLGGGEIGLAIDLYNHVKGLLENGQKPPL